MPLTNVAINKAKPMGKTYRLWDSGGMYLEVSPSGGKWWRWKYRHSGKEKRLSLGTFPDTSLAEARDKRDAARKLLASSIDPSEQRKATKAAGEERSANSFEVVAREWHAKQSSTWVELHASRIMLRLENDIFPWLGSRPIADITAKEFLIPFACG
ncbi:tyrosine-type recombinase/integrase [Dyella japonica]|uniref:Integrase DNA-binding domain-containing protein n=1 Tax=Dyella japonica TaxID=231455 RepID=A0ABV2JZM0_9GAMM